MKEEALKKSQAMLDEDITRFDTFLQANDANALKAMKHAEECGKKRQEVVQNIKLIKQQIAQIQSETGKLREQGEEATRYKKFLEDLTPKDWKEQQVQMAKERAAARKEQWLIARRDEFAEQVRKDIAVAEGALNEVLDGLRRKQKRAPNAKAAKDLRDEIAAAETEFQTKKRKLERAIPSLEAMEKDYQDDAGEEELPLYFQHPQQLVDAFVGLEEQNLFLIQNVQMAEHELEEVESRFKGVIKELQEKTDNLKKNKKRLQKQVRDEEKAIEDIKATFQAKANADSQDKKLHELKEKVSSVYRECHKERDHGDPNTLQMLGSI